MHALILLAIVSSLIVGCRFVCLLEEVETLRSHEELRKQIEWRRY